MPWKTSGVVEERVRFAVEYESGEWTMAELCRHFGIARKTGYKIVERWQQQGTDGLKDLSRAPLHHPNQTPADVEAAVLALRHAHMSWGPRKLRARLEAQHPEQAWPAASTIGALPGAPGWRTRGGCAEGHRPGPSPSPPPPGPTRSGAPISRGGFAPATESASIPSP
jgi:hypothetical protein